MRVCFFLGSLAVNGGIGRATSMLINQISQTSDIECFLLCYCDEKKPNFYYLSEKINQSFLLTSYMSMGTLLIRSGHKRLRTYLQEKNIDLLVACGVLFFPIAVMATRGTKTRVICWEHTAPEKAQDYKAQDFARKFGIKRSDLNVVLTKKALRVYIEKYHAKNTIQIYNPIDTAIINNAGSYNFSSKKIISVGRLTYPKNFSMAIEVAHEVFRRFPDWQWDIFGEGEERSMLLKLISKYNLDKNVHLRGQVDNIYDQYQHYSFMVMTSRYEGFPMSLLEGMGNRLPLISFDIATGPNEIIQNGINGFLVEAGNKEKMIEVICNLIADQELRKRMSRENSNNVDKFSEEKITSKWVQLFSMLSLNEDR